MAEWQTEVKEILGEKMYGKLKKAVDVGKITVGKAQLFAYLLDDIVGGSFKHSRVRQDFSFDGDTFMQILGEYFGKSERAEQEGLPDRIELLRSEDLELNAVALELEEVKPPSTSSHVNTRGAKERKERTRKRWETACKEGKERDVGKLLEEDEELPSPERFLNSNVTEAGTAHLTPLAIAALNGHNEIVKILIQKGASVSRVSSWTPLKMATTGQHWDTSELLISKGSNPKYDLPRELEYYRRNADYRKK